MIIQSLSLDVPAPCLNNCKFCVAHMHRNDYTNQVEQNNRFYDLYLRDFKDRLEFARDNGCNTVMITGNGEPLLNNNYLRMFGQVNSELDRPFRWIEIQTSGTTLDDEKLRFLRNHVKVNTISLSISSFLSSINASHNQTKRGFEVNISEVCKEIKRYDFNLRLSLNLTKDFESFVPEAIFTHSKDFGADQVTLRVLYQSPNKNTSQDLWIQKNAASSSFIKELKEYIRDNGSPLEVLPFGATKYSLHGMSVVLDDDCMSQEVKDSVKYLILRPNCKLYSRWDDEASLVF